MPTVAQRIRSWGYGSAVGAVGLVTALGLLAYPHVELGDVGMLYLPAIMVAAVAGRGPAVLASTLSVIAFDVCFVPPRFTIVVENPRHVVTFAVLFAAGLTISTLVERLRGQVELAQAAAQRAQTEELRSALLSSVSHDLRTPLAVITAAATSAGDPAVPAATRAELLDAVVTEAGRLERMLANLLQLTRVTTGFEPRREWVPLDELCGAALSRVEPLLGERTVLVDVAELAVPVDPVVFELALVNLLENAIKHGAPPIAITGTREDDRVLLAVRDHGPGIAAADADRVFEKFFRASSAPGAGLGLAVTRAVVIAHGGVVRVESAVGGGARFVIELPAAAPPPTAPPPVEDA